MYIIYILDRLVCLQQVSIFICRIIYMSKFADVLRSRYLGFNFGITIYGNINRLVFSVCDYILCL